MGNLSFLIPTKRTEEFTLDNVLTLLKPIFSELKIFKIENFEQLRIENSNEELICEMWKENCYLLEDIDEHVKYFEEGKDFRNINRCLELKNSNLDIGNCIQVNYGHIHDFQRYRTKVVETICKEFGCFWLDEGIHPEYMKY